MHQRKKDLMASRAAFNSRMLMWFLDSWRFQRLPVTAPLHWVPHVWLDASASMIVSNGGRVNGNLFNWLMWDDIHHWRSASGPSLSSARFWFCPNNLLLLGCCWWTAFVQHGIVYLPRRVDRSFTVRSIVVRFRYTFLHSVWRFWRFSLGTACVMSLELIKKPRNSIHCVGSCEHIASDGSKHYLVQHYGIFLMCFNVLRIRALYLFTIIIYSPPLPHHQL